MRVYERDSAASEKNGEEAADCRIVVIFQEIIHE